MTTTPSTAMKWFRLYVEARTDAKLRTLSDAQHRIWFNLLCYAAEQAEPGVIADRPVRLLAVEVANGDVVALAEACQALQDLRIVDVTPRNALHRDTGDTAVTRHSDAVSIVFLKFAQRQYTKPSDSREAVRGRVARSRANKTSAHGSNSVTPCNAPVTPCNAPCNAEEIREEEIHTHLGAGERAREEGRKPPTLAAGRSPEDRAEVEKAVDTLCADLRTYNVGVELGGRHNGRRELQIPGWRWRVAAEKLQGENVTLEQMESFPYLAGIARRVTEAERHRKPPKRRDPDPNADLNRDREAIQARYGGSANG